MGFLGGFYEAAPEIVAALLVESWTPLAVVQACG